MNSATCEFNAPKSKRPNDTNCLAFYFFIISIYKISFSIAATINQLQQTAITYKSELFLDKKLRFTCTPKHILHSTQNHAFCLTKPCILECKTHAFAKQKHGFQFVISSTLKFTSFVIFFVDLCKSQIPRSASNSSSLATPSSVQMPRT